MSSSNTPLLRSNYNNNNQTFHQRSLRRFTLHEAIRFFQRARDRSGLMMHAPSEQVNDDDDDDDDDDDRESTWAYSKPVIIIDLVWNFVYMIVAALVLVLSRNEKPEMPLRVWIVGYCLLCLFHVVSVFLEFKRRGYRQSPFPEEVFGGSDSGSSSSAGSSSGYVTLAELTREPTSNVSKYMDSANTMLSFFWWIIGFYCVCTGGQRMVQESSQLFWLCIVFLAFDVFFVVVCTALACVIGLGFCCCLPCIIAVLCALADQKGAGKEDIEQLPKYIFRCHGGTENSPGEIQGTFAGSIIQCGTDAPNEHSLSSDNAECSICLSTYDNGDELRELPCDHYFHCTCIDKWLYMSATCPLCKRSIIKGGCCSGDA